MFAVIAKAGELLRAGVMSREEALVQIHANNKKISLKEIAAVDPAILTTSLKKSSGPDRQSGTFAGKPWSR